MRKSGILLPIFSLPSSYGIGTFGRQAYKFVDFLVEAKQSYWQILPIGPTSFGDSPYQSFSTYAGNPYFIDIEFLVEEGLLNKDDIEELDFGTKEDDIDYNKMYINRFKVLREAYNNGKLRYSHSLEIFKNENKSWIYDYALFMATKDHYKGKAWKYWEEDIRYRTTDGLKKYSDKLAEEINFYIFLQYLFYKQWLELKRYANSKGIEIIGDIPIYVAEDSSDIWANPKFFELDESLLPLKVSGCPPDAFSDTGQLWGNPTYNWTNLKEDNYKWWVDRIKGAAKIYDVIRIDHFRGFESYWAVPYGDETAMNGTWEKGPGIELFKVINKELGKINIIAEDLGYITKEVRELLNNCNYPGMKVLQFAFNPDGSSEYLPHRYEKNTVVYTGTHDNDTTKGWYKTLNKDEKDFCKYYSLMENEEDTWKLIRLAMGSVADTAIIPMQDYLNLGEEARINIPSTIGINWRWRLKEGQLTKELALEIGKLTKTYGR